MVLQFKRKVERGWEYVTFAPAQQQLRVIEYLMDGDSDRQQWYKEYLCYLCGYPEEEWERVADVKVEMDGEQMVFTVKFANPGKTIEQAVELDKNGFPLVPSHLFSSIDEEAWAHIKRMLSKSSSGSNSTDNQETQKISPTSP